MSSSTAKATEKSGDKAGTDEAGSTPAADGAVTTDPSAVQATGDSGPGTGVTAPPESTYRPPSTIVSDNDDNPLEPPSDHRLQAEPAQGHNESTTDPVYAAIGGRTIAGEDFSALVNENGTRLRASALFDDEDGSKTFVVAKVRAYEQFYYPNTTEKATRLVLVPGQKIPRAQAEEIKAAMKDAPTALADR